MQSVEHAVAPPRSKGARLAGLAVAGLLQILLMWALVEGLATKIWPVPEHRTTLQAIREQIRPTHDAPPPVEAMRDPTEVRLPPPDIPIEEGGTSHDSIAAVQGAPAAYDRMAAPVGDTHTTPHYPQLALRLGEEGDVRLRLTISPQGAVTGAEVLRSSGHRDLDETARRWIMAHWRYRPALRGGVPVTSQSDVQVRFDLRNAG